MITYLSRVPVEARNVVASQAGLVDNRACRMGCAIARPERPHNRAATRKGVLSFRAVVGRLGDLAMIRLRDALYEDVPWQSYEPTFNQLLAAASFCGLPAVYMAHGDFGTGKTRLLRGLAGCAELRKDKLPCTFFNTSDYDVETMDLARVLLTKMGRKFLEVCGGKTRANLFGVLAGSLDVALKFVGKDIGIAAAKEAIDKARRAERAELLGEWTKYDDPIEVLKGEFARMVGTVCAKCGHSFEGTADSKFRPWIVLIDDMDRLFPGAALDTLLSLRAIMGGHFSPGGDGGISRPPVLFVLAMNVDSLRRAIRSRFCEDLGGEDENEGEDFVEHYLRKLALFGPQVPGPDEGGIESALLVLDSIKDLLKDSLKSIEALSTDATVSLPYRASLRAFDRTQMYYALAMNKEELESARDLGMLPLALFVLEVIRHQAQNALPILCREFRCEGNAVSKVLADDNRLLTPQLKALVKALWERIPALQTNQLLWQKAFGLIERDIWSHV